MTQSAAILAHLKRGRTLTPLSALRLYDTLRLSGRILELRRRGHAISTTMVRLRSGKMIAQYQMA